MFRWKKTTNEQKNPNKQQQQQTKQTKKISLVNPKQTNWGVNTENS